MDKKFLKGVAHRLSKIGREVFDEHKYEGVIRHQALPLFKFLKEKGDKVFILTKGTEDVQFGKKGPLKKLVLWITVMAL